MTDSERELYRELYRQTAANCDAIADQLDPDDCMRRPFRLIAQDLERRLAAGAPPQPSRPTRPRSPRGQLHAVPTPEAG